MADQHDHDQIHHPVWDPPWLRASYPRCLWDGGIRQEDPEFCSEPCREMYEQWDREWASRDYGREPVPGLHFGLSAAVPVRTPRRRRTSN